MAVKRARGAPVSALIALPESITCLIFSFTAVCEWNALRSATAVGRKLSLLPASTPHLVTIGGSICQLPLTWRLHELVIPRPFICRDLLWLIVNQQQLRSLRFNSVSRLTEDLISVLTRLSHLSSLRVDRGARSPVAALSLHHFSALVVLHIGLLHEDLVRIPASVTSLGTVWDGEPIGSRFPHLTELALRHARRPLLDQPSLQSLTLVAPLAFPVTGVSLPTSLVSLTLRSLPSDWQYSLLRFQPHLRHLRCCDHGLRMAALVGHLLPWPGCPIQTLQFDHHIDTIKPLVNLSSLKELVVSSIGDPFVSSGYCFELTLRRHSCHKCYVLRLL
jgi:hypothetical protein